MKVPIILLVVVIAIISTLPSTAQVSQQSPQDATVMERGRYVIEIAAPAVFAILLAARTDSYCPT
jgi:hypothetical protein